MKTRLLSVCAFALLTGCATTTLRDPRTGVKLLATGADADTMSYTNGAIAFHATKLNHSRTNAIVAKGITNGITATGASVATSGLLNFLRP